MILNPQLSNPQPYRNGIALNQHTYARAAAATTSSRKTTAKRIVFVQLNPTSCARRLTWLGVDFSALGLAPPTPVFCVEAAARASAFGLSGSCIVVFSPRTAAKATLALNSAP